MTKTKEIKTEVICVECEQNLTESELKYCTDRYIPEDEMVCQKCLRKYFTESTEYN